MTYLDMTVRGRAASDVPDRTVDELVGSLGADLDGHHEERRQHRSEGLGALLGYAAGLSAGGAYGFAARRRRHRIPMSAGAAILTVGAMAAANLPAIVTGVTDPRTWGLQGWVADLVPHMVYGAVTATVYDMISR